MKTTQTIVTDHVADILSQLEKQLNAEGLRIFDLKYVIEQAEYPERLVYGRPAMVGYRRYHFHTHPFYFKTISKDGRVDNHFIIIEPLIIEENYKVYEDERHVFSELLRNIRYQLVDLFEDPVYDKLSCHTSKA